MKTTKNPTFLEETITFWQQKAGVTLSSEDARQAVDNICGFFQVLQEWADAEREDENQRNPEAVKELDYALGEGVR